MGVRDFVSKGSRWLIGNGHQISVWNDKWLPRPFSFEPLHPEVVANPSMKFSHLLNFNLGCWKEDLVKTLFLAIDAELILNLPICQAWSCDHLIWHFIVDGDFSVRSAYHLARSIKQIDSSSTLAPSYSPWKLFGL